MSRWRLTISAKEREEQKKAQGKAKQAQMFGSFFKTAPKPKTKITPTLLTEETPTAGPSCKPCASVKGNVC